MSQIRLTRTTEIDHALAFLRSKYPLMSEAEIIKMVLSEKYQEKKEETMEKEQRIRKVFERLSIEGRKLGDKFLKSKGLKREDLTEEDFYRLLEND